MATRPVMIDRRNKALGGQSNDRPRSAIKIIVWHYTATIDGSIESHERYWKGHHGWDRGGYHFYIDRDGVVYQNYNVERMTWGVANNNGHTVHISLEARNKGDYTPAQIAAREQVTRWLMSELALPATSVKGHWEVYNNSACPGYTKAEMDAFRSALAKPVAEPQKQPSKPVSKSIDELAQEVIKGLHGTGEVRKKRLGAQYAEVQARVNQILAPSVKPKPVVKPDLTTKPTSYKEAGTFYPNTTIIVRNRPSTSGAIIARYYDGEKLAYHTVHKTGGYVWLQYNRANGKQGYIPIRTYKDGKYGEMWGTIK